MWFSTTKKKVVHKQSDIGTSYSKLGGIMSKKEMKI